MIRIVKAERRYFSDFGWMKTYWLFSFSDYYDPNNVNLGSLRVFNDDYIEPGMGYLNHQHREMEIITIVLDGEITHRDSMGNITILRAGDVHRLSAGSGVTHTELNLSTRPVHFNQIWIYPDIRGLSPSYEQKSINPLLWKDILYPIASGQQLSGGISFNTDATIYRTELSSGKSITYETLETRKVLIYLSQGQILVNNNMMNSKDQARIESEMTLKIEAQMPSQFILVDVPSRKSYFSTGPLHN